VTTKSHKKNQNSFAIMKTKRKIETHQLN